VLDDILSGDRVVFGSSDHQHPVLVQCARSYTSWHDAPTRRLREIAAYT